MVKMKVNIVWFLCFLAPISGLWLTNDDLSLNLIFQQDGSIHLNLTKDGMEKMYAVIGQKTNAKNLAGHTCKHPSRCVLQDNDVALTITNIDSGFTLSWETNNISAVFQDCLRLQKANVNWFGGPETFQADWPVENTKFSNRVYTTIKTDNGGVGERYWLNSLGSYVFLDDKVPLFLDQNNCQDDWMCFIASATDPYINRNRVLLQYNLVAKDDAKEAHLHAVNNFLGKPQDHPDEWIIRNPIWTTWAKYKKEISDDVVVSFATDIANHGFTGQIEIDDYWETCYGSATFNDQQFPNINETVKSLKDLAFTVTLWTHPFVNHDCVETVTYGQEHGYFVKSVDGSDQTSWWDGTTAHYIDFTNEEARNWFTGRLKLLQELHGIDSFKFDSGESNYPPPNPVLNGDAEQSPNLITSAYVRTCATFGKLIEVRSAWRTQDLPIFLRMEDKDSRWTLNNGLHSLITSLLQMNINGYSFILPDMIGGNGYQQEQPTAELMVRWTQANTFMPSMQFSYLPWDFSSEDFDATAIIKKYVALHEEYAGEILKAMNESIANGTPVNPPIWWVDPANPDALKANDQYLLGETILVAPVVQEGAVSRDVVIPTGSWKDGNDGKIYEGPQILKDYPASIDILPYFIKQ